MAFGVINLAGPKAREVFEKVTDSDVSNKTFPYAGYRELFDTEYHTRACNASGVCG